MFNSAKSLLVVLLLAAVVFTAAKPLCLQYMTAEAFVRRRNAWLALTVAAFFSPSFWLFALFEFSLLAWMMRKEDNLLALFAIATFTVPNVRYYIPLPLVNQLFDLTQYRLLALCLLVPMVVRQSKANGAAATGGFTVIDAMMLAFIGIQILVPMPYESFTNTMRRAFLLSIDIYIIVYAFQRVATNKHLKEVVACIWLSIALMAPIAIFETLKGWLLYNELSGTWGDPNSFSYLYRGQALRAQVAAGHSLTLGYLLAVGLGAFFFLWRPGVKRQLAWLVIAVFSAALIATGSRGAWLTAVVAATTFVAFRPNAGRRLAGTAMLTVVVLSVLYISPLKESVIDRLPIIGVTDQDTIQYRQQLFETSWRLIKLNPFFGDPFVVDQLGSLTQGQGIIDIVNGYVYIALFNGGIALALFVGSFFYAIWRSLTVLLRLRATAEEMGTLGAALLSITIASMFFIATAGFGPTNYVILGLLCSYWRLNGRSSRYDTFNSGRSPAFSL